MAQEEKKLQNEEIQDREMEQVNGGLERLGPENLRDFTCMQCGRKFSDIPDQFVRCPSCGSPDLRKEL